MLIHRFQFQEILLSDHKHSKQIDELFSTGTELQNGISGLRLISQA